MNVRISFDVDEATLDDAVAAAQTKLATFLGSDGDIDSWHVSLYCTPLIDTGVGSTLLWKVEVEAVRGHKFGP